MRRSLSRIWAIFKARNYEFFRDRSSLGWSLLFPFLVVYGFSFAFSGDSQKLAKFAVVAPSDAEALLKAPPVGGIPHVDRVAYPNVEAALAKLRRHQVDIVVDPASKPLRYWISESSPKGFIAEKLLRDAAIEHDGLGHAVLPLERAAVEGREIRYVDWLMPGLLGMNMMFAALFGVGYVIVRYRKNGVLKRLKATPVRPFEFLVAQVLSRLYVIVATTAIVFVGTNFLLKFNVMGSYWLLLLILVLGALALISVGLLIAARVKSEELAGGVLNLLSWPMMFLSGVWFSLEGANPIMRNLAKVLPLTHANDAARLVMNEGATFVQVLPQLVTLAGITVVCLALGSWIFRWD